MAERLPLTRAAAHSSAGPAPRPPAPLRLATEVRPPKGPGRASRHPRGGLGARAGHRRRSPHLERPQGAGGTARPPGGAAAPAACPPLPPAACPQPRRRLGAARPGPVRSMEAPPVTMMPVTGGTINMMEYLLQGKRRGGTAGRRQSARRGAGPAGRCRLGRGAARGEPGVRGLRGARLWRKPPPPPQAGGARG